jgi:type IV pilus assembly protein PilV
MTRTPPRARQGGFSMLEVLVTLVITAFGLLGLAGFVTRSTAVSVDANQRARASALLADMGNRIQNNKAQAASYVSATVYGAAAQSCAGASGAALDLCEWNNLLVGTNDALTSSTLSQALTYRGCITQPVPGDPLYVVTVAWGSSLPGVPPADTCAENAFGSDTLRRVIRTQVRIATLAA